MSKLMGYRNKRFAVSGISKQALRSWWFFIRRDLRWPVADNHRVGNTVSPFLCYFCVRDVGLKGEFSILVCFIHWFEKRICHTDADTTSSAKFSSVAAPFPAARRNEFESGGGAMADFPRAAHFQRAVGQGRARAPGAVGGRVPRHAPLQWPHDQHGRPLGGNAHHNHAGLVGTNVP